MPELIINSAPQGAEVQLDGVLYGTTPVTFTIDEVDGLAEFRAECMYDGSVVCSWSVLQPMLEDHTVSRLWWLLTEPERRSIAGKAIMSTLNRTIWYYRKEENSEWSRQDSPCTYNAIIRFQKFGTPIGWHNCYWTYDEDDTVGVCYAPEHYFGLPTVHVNTHHHVMCGIQVVDSIDALDNWVVFQYGNPNIKPGNSQMPHGSHIIIQDPFPYDFGTCIGFDSRVITTFQL